MPTPNLLKNAHGLDRVPGTCLPRTTNDIMGRHLLYDTPPNTTILFRASRLNAACAGPPHHRAFSAPTKALIGIKTGYTRAAGFNLTPSARTGQ